MTVLIVALLALQDDPIPEPTPADDWTGEFLPPGVLYRPYLAAPRQSRSSFKLHVGGGKNGVSRFETTLGLYQPLARWTGPDAELELSIEGASFSRFNRAEHWDMDASDFRVGLPVAYRTGDVTLKAHLWHLSSHLGDEYAERTGRRRTAYRFEELAGGVSWDASNESRLYGEAGWMFSTMGPAAGGRFQFGYERVNPKAESAAPYLAVDLEVRTESGWDMSKTFALGYLFPIRKISSAFRLGLELYHGRDQQTQFFGEQERYLSLVVALDVW